MASQRVNITSPVGRVVMGNLYVPNTTDFDGNPLVFKTGTKIGQPRVDYFFALAIPKGAEQHWASTEWGAKIWAIGHQAFPQAAQAPSFAWKIEDGDSVIPNKKGRKNVDTEGYKGHWVIRFSGSMAPKVYRSEGNDVVAEPTPNYIKPGYFAQVLFNVEGNGNQNNPGVYLNHDMVCFRAYGPEIAFGLNVAEAGFGAAPLPAGATLTPPPSAIPMPSTSPNAQGVGVPPYGGSVSAITTVPAVPIPVVPNPHFLQVPPPNPTLGVTASIAAAPMPPAPASPSSIPTLPPVPAGPQMTAKANGISQQAYLAAGWTNESLVANGYMTL